MFQKGVATGLLRQRTSVKQVECLLEELPAKTKVHRKLWRDLPVVLEIDCNVVLFEGNQGIALCQTDGAYTLQKIAVIGVSVCAILIRQEGVGRVLISNSPPKVML